MTDSLMVDVIDARSLSGTIAMISFDDGVTRIVDLSPLMTGPIFDDVRRNGWISNFYVDADLGTLVWPNGADLPPARLRHEAPDAGWSGPGDSGSGVTRFDSWMSTLDKLAEVARPHREGFRFPDIGPAGWVDKLPRQSLVVTFTKLNLAANISSGGLESTTREFIEDSQQVKIPC